MKKLFSILLFLTAAGVFSNCARAQLVIANSSVKSSDVSKSDLRDVFTGASSSFKDGSHVTLSPDATVVIGKLRETVLTGATDRLIQLHQGEVDSEVTHATKKDDRFQIRSPSVIT